MPFRDDDGSTFGDIAKSAAIGAPIGIGARKWWQATDFNSVIDQARMPAMSPKYTAAHNAAKSASFGFTGSIASRLSEWNYVELNNLIDNINTQKTGLSADDIRSALLRAAENSDPSGTTVTALTKKLNMASDPISVLEDLNTIARGSERSIYMQRTISSFLDNIQMMEDRVLAGKSITPTELPGISLSRTTGVNLGRMKEVPRTQFLGETIERMAQKLGGTVSVRAGYRQGAASPHEMILDFFHSKQLGKQRYREAQIGREPIAQMSLRIPVASKIDPNIVTHGATGQSTYIAGQFWQVEQELAGRFALKRKMRYEEWAAHHALEQLVPGILNEQRKTRSSIHALENQFHESILRPLQWVDDLPEGVHPGLDEYKRMRGQIAHLYGPGGKALSDLQYADVLRHGVTGAGTVYPSASAAQMAKNVVSLQDWRNVEAFPGAFDWGKRPLQRIRGEFYPTESAIQAMQQDILTQEYKWISQRGGPPSPMMRTAYVKGSQVRAAARLGMNVEGAGLIAGSKIPLFGQQEIVRYNVSSEGLLDLADILGDPTQTTWSGQVNIPAGRTLGYDPSGAPVVMKEDITLLEAKRFQDRNKGDFVKLTGVRQLEGMERFKAFGGAKAMMRSSTQESIDELARVALGINPLAGSEINAIVTVDELKKNRALHNKQMLTSLHEFTKMNMQSGKQVGTLASNFLLNPEKILARMNEVAGKGQMFQHEEVMRQMVGMARAGKLSPSQLGRVFGAVPEILGIEEGAPDELRRAWMKEFGFAISKKEARAISAGTPIGLTQFSFGGMYGPGTGNVGSIEPRMFEFLSSPHFGSFGPEMQEEVATRMMARYPHKLGEQRALRESLSGLLDPSGHAGIAPSAWTDEMFQKGGLLNIPGMGDVSIPGAEKMAQLSSYRTAGGLVIEPELEKGYRGLVSSAAALGRGEITREAMRESMTGLAQDVSRAGMATVTGTDSLLRGRLPGSRFLTAVPAEVGSGLLPGEVGITGSYFRQMSRDLEKIYGKGEMEQIRRRFFAGEAIGGLIGRHPFIGPYSTSAVGIRRIAGSEPIAMVGEELATAFLHEEGVIKELGAVRMGPAVGMAMDYDADIANVMLLSSNMEGKALERSASIEADAYAIRSQLLKAKAASGTTLASAADAAAGAALKLRIPQERLGLISESLQVARAAVLSNTAGLETQRTMNALGFLEWLEQTPISAKHIRAGEEAGMISSLEGIRTAIETRDAGKLARGARSIIGAGTVGERFLEKGAQVGLQSLDDMRFVDVPGIEIGQASEDIMGAMKTFSTEGVEGISPQRVRQLIRTRGVAASEKEMRAMLNYGMKGASPFSGLLSTAAQPSKVTSAVGEIQAIRNKAASAGGQLIRNYKPLALGFGAAVGIATLFSAPPKTLAPGATTPPPPRMKGSTGGSHVGTDIRPQDHVGGQPTVHNMVSSQNTARIAPTGTHVNIQGLSPGAVDYGALNSQLSRSVRGMQVSSRVIDNRESMTSQKIARILREGQ
jgi:hypothetical protein